MKLFLIGSLSKLQRLVTLGLTSSEDEVVLVAWERELPGKDTLLEYDAAVIDWGADAVAPGGLLRRLRVHAPSLPVLALVAGEAVAAGAQETALKSADLASCRAALQKIARTRRRPAAAQPGDELQMIIQSEAMEAVLSVAWRAAPTTASILILGENGTGKSQLARAIHARSGRAAGPFVCVNCTAEGGTLFLDEIGELPPEIQAKLLRLLQERCYERVGEARTRRADIRVLAATNRDLRQQVAANAFREDLYYRLNVITLEMSPLRARLEDIIPLAEHFLAAMSRSAGEPRRELTFAAREALAAHVWPGNLRELRNVIERAAILCDREWLDAADFLELADRTEGSAATRQVGDFVTLAALVEAHIRQVTSRTESDEQAARILGIAKSTLYRWRKWLENFDPAAVDAACAS